MRIIPRSEWGARWGDGSGSRPLPAREAWLHHSVTIAPDLNPPFDDDDAAIRTIDKIGRDRFGSVYGFPYTFGITPVGRIYQGHAVGQQGAHTANHNYQAIGIVFVGNYETNKPTEAQLNACAWLLNECKRRGWLTSNRLSGGHRDTKATACPGKYAYAQIAEINRRANKGPVKEEEEEMPTAKEIAEAVRDLPADPDNPKSATLGQFVRSTMGQATKTRYTGDRIEAKVDALIVAMRNHNADLGRLLQDALADATVEVDVNISQPPPESEPPSSDV